MKQRLQKHFIITVLLFIFSCQGFAEERHTVVFGLEHWPPATIIEDGLYTGIDVDIINIIAKQLNWDVVFFPCPFVRCLKSMEEGEIDLLSSIDKTPQRETYMSYVEPPAYINRVIIFYYRKSDPVDITQYSDLKNLKIGIKRGAVYFDMFDNDSSLNIVAVPSDLQLFKMLASGRVDSFVGYEASSDYIIAKSQYKGMFGKAHYREYRPGGFFAFSKKSERTQDKTSFGEILKSLIKTGIIEDIETKYGIDR